MADTITGFTLLNPFNIPSTDASPLSKSLRRTSVSRLSRASNLYYQNDGYGKGGNNRTSFSSSSRDVRANAWPTLMAVLVEHTEGQRDLITHKSIWHLSDQVIKNVYTVYIMFTCWGCCLFGSMKDPYYDSETYRKDGGDGTGHWVYDKQEDMEERARAELWREELIEEIEQKVGSLKELEEVAASTKK